MTIVATPRPPSPARSHRAGLFHARTILNQNVATMCKINDAQQVLSGKMQLFKIATPDTLWTHYLPRHGTYSFDVETELGRKRR